MNTTPTSPSFSLGEASGKVIEGPSPISSSIESSSAGNSSIALDGPSGFQWLDGNGKRKPETVDLTLDDEPEKTEPAVAKTAKAWIQDFDAKHPVPADDPDLQRFVGRMELLTRRLCQHARSGDITAWYRLPQEEQDMAIGFKTELRKADPVHLLHQGLSHMPRKVQQGFGKQDLQEDVVPNFRIGGLWDIPGVLNQDTLEYLPTFWEGLLMVYTGTYHTSQRAPGAPPLLSVSSYRLVQELRTGLPLPDFHMQSLNIAWPLKQGFRPIGAVSKAKAEQARRAAEEARRARRAAEAEAERATQDKIVQRILLTQHAMDNAGKPEEQDRLAREYEVLIADIQASGAPWKDFDRLLEKTGPKNPNYTGPHKLDISWSQRRNLNPNFVGVRRPGAPEALLKRPGE
ncbi:hypothetical protein H9Q73_005374 [Fusarium xylarioides]|nr:hypothetical protein H9Q73_005374 [Fusarium xylarioides]